MQIFVDADACPVVGIVEEIAEKYNIPTTLLCDTNRILYSDYSEVIVVGAGADAVDYKLISICHKGDVVVTQVQKKMMYALHSPLKNLLQVLRTIILVKLRTTEVNKNGKESTI